MTINLLNTYNDLMSKINALRAEAKEAARAILHEGTKSYFEKHGSVVEQIVWRQYTPWFNDGETCEFYAHEPFIVLHSDSNEEKYDEGSLFCNDIDTYKASLALWADFNADPEAYKDKINANAGGRYFDGRWTTRENYKPYFESEKTLLDKVAEYNSYPDGLVMDTDDLLDIIDRIDDSVKEELFGNHVTVRISASGIETEDYLHD